MLNLEQLAAINKEPPESPHSSGCAWERKIMAVWALILGMITLINVTMVAALMQVFGGVPDQAFLKIMARYLLRKDEPREISLGPWETASRLRRVYRRIIEACAAAAVIGAGLTAWALVAGWGPIAMSAITFWVIAGDLLFASVAPANWQRRARRIDPNFLEDEEAGRPSIPDNKDE